MKNIVIILLCSMLLTNCALTEGTPVKGSSLKRTANEKAGIVRMPQFLNCDSKGKNCKDQETFMWSYYDATKRGSMMYLNPE